MPPQNDQQFVNQYGPSHPISMNLARARTLQSQRAAQAMSPMKPPPLTPPSPHEMAMANYGRSGPMPVGARSNLHAAGDTGLGTQDLWGSSARAADRYLAETSPGISQQGPQFQAWANHPGRIAQDQAAHGLWDEDRLAQETTKAQGQLQGRVNRMTASRGLPSPQMFRGPTPTQPGQGLLSGMQVPRPPAVRVPQPPAQAQAPASAQDHFAFTSPVPGVGAMEGIVPGYGSAALNHIATALSTPVGPEQRAPRADLASLPETPGRIGWGNLQDRARFQARQGPPDQRWFRTEGNPQVQHPGAPPAVAVPQPGTMEHLQAAQRAWQANPSRATASAADMAERLFYNAQEQAERSARIGNVQADTEARRLGFPGITAGNREAAGRADQLNLQNMMTQGVAALSPMARALYGMMSAGLATPDQVRAEQAKESAIGGGGPPTAFTGEQCVRSAMPDFDAITGGFSSRRPAYDAFVKAREQGYQIGPDYPGGGLNDDFRAMLRGKVGERTWQDAMREPAPGTFGMGYPVGEWNNPISRALSGYNPFPGGHHDTERDYANALAFARWARGQVASPTNPRIQVPVPPTVAVPLPPPQRPRVGPWGNIL